SEIPKGTTLENSRVSLVLFLIVKIAFHPGLKSGSTVSVPFILFGN
ncbi:unnamed protein product, partial [marine sediment metagenome]